MKYKNILNCIFILIPSYSLAQYHAGFEEGYFFARQPAARAEAMGKGYVAMDGDLYSVFYNPAGIGTMKGIEMDLSGATPYYLADKAHFYFASAGMKISKYFATALTMHQLSLGELEFVDETGNFIGVATPRSTNYSVTLASQPLKNLYIGLNANMYQVTPPSIFHGSTAYYFDFGIIKTFSIAKTGNTTQTLNAAGSIVNLNSSKMTFELSSGNLTEALPVISRLGVCYKLILDKPRQDSLNLLEFILEPEYEDLLNSEYHTSFKVGMEIKVLEILALRMGYYTENEYDFGIPDVNYDRIHAFTYGFGLSLPIEKLTHHKVPLNFSFDYTSLPQVRYSSSMPAGFSDYGKFSSMSLKLNWNIGRK